MRYYDYTYLPVESNLLCQDVSMPLGYDNNNIHVHHNDELVFINSVGTVTAVSHGQAYALKTPALLWNRTGVFHEITQVLEADFHCWVISYHNQLFAELPRHLRHDHFLDDCDMLYLPLQDSQVRTLTQLMACMRPKGTPQFQRLMYLMSLFDMMSGWVPECCQVIRTSGTPHYVFQLASQLQDLSWEMPSLDELAQQYFVGKTKLKNDFKKIIGMPILSFRHHVQLQTACALLETTDLDMSQIAGQCGFSDQSYFIRLFRKHYGITPGVYRKQHCH